MMKRIEKGITINSNPEIIWKTLTQPELMKLWMGEAEMQIEVDTQGDIHGPITMNGFYHVPFENSGVVLRYEPFSVLQYSQLSSLSRLADKPENYSVLMFKLTPGESQTLLTVNIENFPTDSIFKHLELYWNATLNIIKQIAEDQSEEPK